MSTQLLLITSALYVGAAFNLWQEGKEWMALVLVCYALANGFLVLATT